MNEFAEIEKCSTELITEAAKLADLAGVGSNGNHAAAELSGPEHLTDLGNTRRLINHFGDNVKFCHQWGRWLTWDEKRWRSDETGEIIRLAKETVRRIYKEAIQAGEEDRQKIGSWATKSESDSKIRAIVKLAESEPEVTTTPDRLDMDPWLFNTESGTINLRTGELRESRQRDLITKIAPVFFDPTATCPRWEEFLSEIFDGREGLLDFIWRALGYSITADTREQCLFVLYGSGANGKSTFIETVRGLMGNYAQATNFSTFLKKDHDGISNDIAALSGARFVSATEAESGRRLSEVLIKQLTGGDIIRARFLYAEEFDFRPSAKFWLATNHKPIIRGADLAIWRRIRLIPFTVTVPEEKQDRTLAAKLKTEAPGILAWIVRGALAWQERGLQAPDEVKEATAEYRNEMDVLGDFISECCLLKPEVMASAGDLYQRYSGWAEKGGEKNILSKRAFGQALAERGFEAIRTSGSRSWKGIGVTQ